MKYCYNCNRATIREPLFCNFCGRSYNIKLCPKLHVNPRNAEPCSHCGSRELSLPQPKVPFWPLSSRSHFLSDIFSMRPTCFLPSPFSSSFGITLVGKDGNPTLLP